MADLKIRAAKRGDGRGVLVVESRERRGHSPFCDRGITVIAIPRELSGAGVCAPREGGQEGVGRD